MNETLMAEAHVGGANPPPLPVLIRHLPSDKAVCRANKHLGHRVFVSLSVERNSGLFLMGVGVVPYIHDVEMNEKNNEYIELITCAVKHF